MQVGLIAADILAGILLMAAWYAWFQRRNRHKGIEIMRWVEGAFHGQARVAEFCWTRPARLEIRVRTASALFRDARLTVQLLPRELPLRWLLSCLRHERESISFEADLDAPPAFNLEVHNHRWYGRTRRRLPRDRQGWILGQAGPFVLTTRNDWQREITHMIHAVLASRDCPCLAVRIRRSSPHFSVTLPLEAMAPDSPPLDLFAYLRELASGVSAAKF
jgi:hypothetical protein